MFVIFSISSLLFISFCCPLILTLLILFSEKVFTLLCLFYTTEESNSLWLSEFELDNFKRQKYVFEITCAFNVIVNGGQVACCCGRLYWEIIIEAERKRMK